MVVQPVSILRKLHGGSILFVNNHGRFDRAVHYHPAYLADILEGQNVCQGTRVIPHGAKTSKVAEHRAMVRASVGFNGERGFAAANVGEENWVLEN